MASVYSDIRFKVDGRLKLLVIVGTRPEALDKACFTLAGISEKGLLQAVHTAVELDAEGSLPEAPVPDYADETVSTKVVKIIQSYTGVVDKMVWRKSL